MKSAIIAAVVAAVVAAASGTAATIVVTSKTSRTGPSDGGHLRQVSEHLKATRDCEARGLRGVAGRPRNTGPAGTIGLQEPQGDRGLPGVGTDFEDFTTRPVTVPAGSHGRHRRLSCGLVCGGQRLHAAIDQGCAARSDGVLPDWAWGRARVLVDRHAQHRDAEGSFSAIAYCVLVS